MTRALACGAVLLLAACAGGKPGPAELDPRNESCAWCRMAVSDARFAAQVVAEGEEPRFFDDVGCLAHYLKGHPGGPAVAYVADHRTKGWVLASEAVYTRMAGQETPMGSRLVAHESAASRDQDPAAAGGMRMTVAEVFGGPMTAGATP